MATVYDNDHVQAASLNQRSFQNQPKWFTTTGKQIALLLRFSLTYGRNAVSNSYKPVVSNHTYADVLKSFTPKSLQVFGSVHSFKQAMQNLVKKDKNKSNHVQFSNHDPFFSP